MRSSRFLGLIALAVVCVCSPVGGAAQDDRLYASGTEPVASTPLPQAVPGCRQGLVASKSRMGTPSADLTCGGSPDAVCPGPRL